MPRSGFDVFGTGVRSKALIAIYVLEETHAPELARLLGTSITTARNAVDTLERAGLVVGRMEGNTRRVRLNPQFRALRQLRDLLQELSLSDVGLLKKIADLRRRPRRMGKDL
jgi:DNA-binding MarR family transcriptional regulator